MELMIHPYCCVCFTWQWSYSLRSFYIKLHGTLVNLIISSVYLIFETNMMVDLKYVLFCIFGLLYSNMENCTKSIICVLYIKVILERIDKIVRIRLPMWNLLVQWRNGVIITVKGTCGLGFLFTCLRPLFLTIFPFPRGKNR